jgi:beta-barrel assembly-enhancing protease
MTKKFIIFSVLMLWLIKCLAQDADLNNFKYLQSSGTIPADFTSLFSEKFEQDKVLLSNEDKKSLRKTKENFLMESNFIIDQILLSGRILFNDPVSNYINKVADILLESQPDLRKELRFYVAKSASVNAFSTDKGIIIVNLGLVAQLENEAQLAYILSHEIIHYVKKHNMNLFLEKNIIYMGKDRYKKLSISEKYFATNFRNQEMESEADKLGLNDVYIESNYSLKVLDGVFDVLQYSYLPFDDVAFDTTFFETPYMKFPNKYFLYQINQIKGDEEYDETKSTHPSIKSRRDIMQIMISEKSNTGKKDFILPKEDFFKVRALARFESIHQYIVLRDYGNAIYNSFIMLKDYPGNKFLETSIAYSLYALSEYKLKGSTSGVLSGYKNIEGQSQQVYYFLNNLKKDEMNAIALHYAWKLHQQYPKDEFVTMLCDRLFDNLVIKGKKSLSDFFRKPKEEIKADIENLNKQSDTLVQGSKYDKIKKNKAKQELKDDNYLRYAFVDLFKDPDFIEMFTGKINKQSAKDKIQLTEKEKQIAAKREKREDRKIRKYGEAIGIDTVLLIDPFYFVFDERKKTNISYFASENKLLDFTDRLFTNAKRAGLTIEVLNPKSFKVGDVDRFNDLGRVNDWIVERFNHDNSTILPFETRNSKDVMEKFNTKHVAWTGIMTVRKKKDNLAFYIIASIIMPLYLPYTIPMMIMPSYDTYYYYILFDTETGKNELQISLEANSNDRSDFLNSWIYYTMSQVKNSRK